MTPGSATPQIRIGVDIGGTFTDFVVYHSSSGQLETFKLPSTPHNPAQAVLDGLNRIRDSLDLNKPVLFSVVHGSTVATNALLERKGA
jgi:N-methylhydantoinase A